MKNYKPDTKNYRVIELLEDHMESPGNPLDQTISKTDSVLFIRLSAIGDVIRLLPTVHYLREQGFTGKLGWAVQPPCDQFLKKYKPVDIIHRIDRDRWWAHPIRLIQQLFNIRQYSYDWVFDFHGLLKSTAVSLGSGSNRKIGFDASNCKEGNHLFQTQTIEQLPKKLPRILKYIQLIRAFLPQNDSLRRSDLIPNIAIKKTITESIAQAANLKPILIHPRTSQSRYGKTKEWGVSNFIQFLKKIREDPIDYPTIFITWGPNEYDTAKKIAGTFGSNIKVAPETPNLSNLVHLISSAQLLLSGDTAPCHIADIVQTPLIALFGASDYLVSGPLLTNYRTITDYKRGEETTEDIPADRVYRHFLELWKQN